LKHHSAVELVDRLEAHGYVHRSRGRDDRRRVLVSLLPRGERILEDVARQRIDELRSYGRELAQAIEHLLQRRTKRTAAVARKDRSRKHEVTVDKARRQVKHEATVGKTRGNGG